MKLPFELSFEWRIALRYLRAGKRARRNSFISFISLISVLGIALGVAALIIVLSVMNGFQKDVRDRMLSVLAHIEVRANQLDDSQWRDMQQTLVANSSVVATAPFSSAQTVFVNQGEMHGAILRGVDAQAEKSVMTLPLRYAKTGLSQLKSGEFGVILGVDLAHKLGVGLGDRVTVMLPQGGVTPAGMLPRFKILNVTDIFESGHYEYDASLAYLALADVQTLLRQEQPEGLRVRIKDINSAPLVRRDLQRALSSKPYFDSVSVLDWSQQNRNWFAAVQTEKRLMGIILFLIIAVAAFNLVSTLVMTVTEKYADIAILRTMGASRTSVMKIFMVQGALSGSLGTLCGALLGTLVALNLDVIVPVIEAVFRIQFLPKEIYLISTLPSDVQWSDVITITLTSLMLAFVATIYPSYRAARIEPAQALRHE